MPGCFSCWFSLTGRNERFTPRVILALAGLYPLEAFLAREFLQESRDLRADVPQLDAVVFRELVQRRLALGCEACSAIYNARPTLLGYGAWG